MKNKETSKPMGLRLDEDLRSKIAEHIRNYPEDGKEFSDIIRRSLYLFFKQSKGLSPSQLAEKIQEINNRVSAI